MFSDTNLGFHGLRTWVLFGALVFAGSVRDSSADSWTARTISSSDLFDVSATAGGKLWSVGKTGTLLASTDNGQTWSAQSSGTASDLMGVDFVDANRGWAVGANDTVVRTTNGGATWTTNSTGTSANLSDVDFVDANNGWSVGTKLFLANAVVHTSDGGTTWTEQNAPAGIGLVSVSFADSQHGFIGGFEDVAYRTDDGGQTWIAMAIEPNGNTGDSFYAVRRLNANVGLAAGFKGIIYRTQDGGLTWTIVGNFGKPIRGLAATGTSAFAVGDAGLIARSEDSGASWELQASGTLYDLKGVAAASATSAFAVGVGGTLVQFQGGSSSIPVPLDVSSLPEFYQVLSLAWKHDAAGTAVTAATGDLDGDGNNEIVIAGPSGLRALHPFSPSDQATVWSLPFQARFQQVHFAELDRNSATREIVAGTAASGISRSGVLAVKGTGEVLWSRQIPGGSRALRVGDFNKDGIDDVVSIGDGKTISWLSGADGADLFPPRAVGATPTDLDIGDLNHDGVPDVVVTFSDGRVVAYDGATGEELWSYQSQAGDTGGFGGLRAVALGDLNGDGVLDVVAVGEGTPTSSIPGNGDCSSLTIGTTKGALIVAINGMDGTRLWDYAEPGSEMFSAVSLGDFNGDGIPDVVAHADTIGKGHLVALDGRGLTVNGIPTGDAQSLWALDTTRGSDSSQFATSSEAIAIGDGNSDGTPDAYVALFNGYLVGLSGLVPASMNPRCAPPATELWEANRTGIAYFDSFGIFNNEPFLLTLFGGDNLVALRNPANGAVAWPYDNGGSPVFAIGDLDGDGHPEIGVGTLSGRVYALKADGTPLSLNDNFLPQAVVGIVTAPVLGGSASELVAASSDGTVRAVNPRTGMTIWEKQIGVAATSIAGGSAIIGVGTASGNVVGLDVQTGAVKWQWPGTVAIKAIVFSSSANLFAAGDLNGDIRFLNAAGELQNTYPTGTATLGGVQALALADVDGDGIQEFAVAAGQSFFVLHSDGSFFWRYDVPAAGSALASQIAPVDFSGNGTQDIVGAVNGFASGSVYALAGPTGGLLWSINNGISGGIAGMDINGDGKQEALLGTQSLGFPLGSGTLRALDGNGHVAATCILAKSPSLIAVADFNGAGNPQAAVGMMEGDIYLLHVASAVQLTAVASRKIHGSAGSFDIDLPLTGIPGIECRTGGANGDYTIVFSFSNPLTSVGGASVTSGAGSVSSSAIDGSDAHRYIVNLTGVTNAQTLTISLTNVSDATGNFSVSIAATMSVLVGDVNGSGRVDAADVSSVRQQTLQAVVSSNFREDINTSGRIDAADVSIARQQTLTSLP